MVAATRQPPASHGGVTHPQKGGIGGLHGGLHALPCSTGGWAATQLPLLEGVPTVLAANGRPIMNGSDATAWHKDRQKELATLQTARGRGHAHPRDVRRVSP